MAQLPDYVASATPNPVNKRAGWLTTTAAGYAGIMLWFVFWQDVPGGGVLSKGLPLAIAALFAAAAICYVFFYHVPAKLGVKTGLPLYIVGTSVYGVKGGFILPGFLMGVLQFGWLAVNGYFSSLLIAAAIGAPINSVTHLAIGVVWTVVAAFVGLKGIQYVSKVSTYLPIIPIVALIWLFFKTIGGVGEFNPAAGAAVAPFYGSDTLGVFNTLIPYVVGFFATAGAAGCDFGSGNRDGKSVVKAGLVGVFLTTFLTGLVALLAIAGAQPKLVKNAAEAQAKFELVAKETPAASVGLVDDAFLAKSALDTANKDKGAAQGAKDSAGVKFRGAEKAVEADPAALKLYNARAGFVAALELTKATNPTVILDQVLGKGPAQVLWILLVISAFPAACFSSLIAANSFKSTFPKVSPFVTCGIGTVGAVALVLSTAAGQAAAVFTVIGASFGPVCGALFADYLLAGRKWAGPRDGFNPAGWLSWVLGFAVGGISLVSEKFLHVELPFVIPVPPVSAFVVGFIAYFVFATLGLTSKKLDMPKRIDA